MRDLLPNELSRVGGVAGECDCCPVPCCSYCRVQIAWTIVASASRSSGFGPARIEETVNWNVPLVMIFNRLDDIGAPASPPTFRVVEAAEEEDCQLLSNGGPFYYLTPGSYTYIKTTGGVETDREEADLLPQINQFQIYLDCDCMQKDDPASVVGFSLDAGVGGIGTMPAQWVGYLNRSTVVYENIGEATPCVGLKTTIQTNELAGWDASSLTSSSSVAITRCEDI